MSASFQPLSALTSNLLIEYLGREGHSPEVVQWKYFDSGFNRGRERGYAWIKDGKIGGFIGLIPCQLAIGARRAEAAWTCDWSVQHASGRGVGILLIRQAQQNYEFLLQLGGNTASHQIVSRLASKTVEDAGIVFHLPLRLGALLRIARRRVPRLPVDFSNLVNRIPLRIPKRPASSKALIEPGVSRVLAPLLEPSREETNYPRYDMEYVQWQVGNCPDLLSETCYVPGEPAPRAAALIWRPKASPEFWRMALWSREDAQEEVNQVLSTVIRHVYEQSGLALSVVVSRLDTTLIAVLRSQRFFAAPKRRPLHIIADKKDGDPIPELQFLSFLDTDYAYRFGDPTVPR